MKVFVLNFGQSWCLNHGCYPVFLGVFASYEEAKLAIKSHQKNRSFLKKYGRRFSNEIRWKRYRVYPPLQSQFQILESEIGCFLAEFS